MSANTKLAEPYHLNHATGPWDAIVIGSGIGGLAVAALLSRYGGKRVLVLERHYTPGGFTHTFRRGTNGMWACITSAKSDRGRQSGRCSTR